MRDNHKPIHPTYGCAATTRSSSGTTRPWATLTRHAALYNHPLYLVEHTRTRTAVGRRPSTHLQLGQAERLRRGLQCREERQYL